MYDPAIRKVTTDTKWDEMGVYDCYRQHYRETIDQEYSDNGTEERISLPIVSPFYNFTIVWGVLSLFETNPSSARWDMLLAFGSIQNWENGGDETTLYRPSQSFSSFLAPTKIYFSPHHFPIFGRFALWNMQIQTPDGTCFWVIMYDNTWKKNP